MARAGLGALNTKQASFSNPTDGLTTALNAFQTQMANTDERERQLARQKKADTRADSEHAYKLEERAKTDAEKAALLKFETSRMEDNLLGDAYVTNAYSNKQSDIDAMSYTPEEIALSEKVKGDETQYTPGMLAKKKAQMALSNKSDEISAMKGLQETEYEEAVRLSKGMPMTASLVQRLNQLKAADITAKDKKSKENKDLLELAKKADENNVKYQGRYYTALDKANGVGKSTKTGSSSYKNSNRPITNDDLLGVTKAIDQDSNWFGIGDSDRQKLMDKMRDTNIVGVLNSKGIGASAGESIIKDAIAKSVKGDSLNNIDVGDFKTAFTLSLANYVPGSQGNGTAGSSGSSVLFNQNQADIYNNQAADLRNQYLKSKLSRQDIVNNTLFGSNNPVTNLLKGGVEADKKADKNSLKEKLGESVEEDNSIEADLTKLIKEPAKPVIEKLTRRERRDNRKPLKETSKEDVAEVLKNILPGNNPFNVTAEDKVGLKNAIGNRYDKDPDSFSKSPLGQLLSKVFKPTEPKYRSESSNTRRRNNGQALFDNPEELQSIDPKTLYDDIGVESDIKSVNGIFKPGNTQRGEYPADLLKEMRNPTKPDITKMSNNDLNVMLANFVRQGENSIYKRDIRRIRELLKQRNSK